MLYKGFDIVSVTVFGEKKTQIYRRVFVITPDGSVTPTDSEAKARRIADARARVRRANGKEDRKK